MDSINGSLNASMVRDTNSPRQSRDSTPSWYQESFQQDEGDLLCLQASMASPRNGPVLRPTIDGLSTLARQTALQGNAVMRGEGTETHGNSAIVGVQSQGTQLYNRGMTQNAIGAGIGPVQGSQPAVVDGRLSLGGGVHDYGRPDQEAPRTMSPPVATAQGNCQNTPVARGGFLIGDIAYKPPNRLVNLTDLVSNQEHLVIREERRVFNPPTTIICKGS